MQIMFMVFFAGLQTGWYEMKEKVFLKIEDMMYICAMGPPGGGRTFITPRFTRLYTRYVLQLYDC
jgi:dynein heavy chain